ncbi:MAG: HIT family protein [Patescibacteria group bacterium]|nr:HIT family protein [Patescibacteria group bacterium]
MEDCIFCKIIKGEIPSSKIYEDDKVLAFLDANPINRGHILIIPKVHQQFITDLDDLFLEKMIIIAKKINKALRESEIKPEAVNLLLSDGEVAGQEIFHSHLHVIPRFKEDNFNFSFPSNEKPTKEDLDKVATEIKQKLKSL